MLLPITAALFYIPTSRALGSSFSTSYLTSTLTLAVSCFIDRSHPNGSDNFGILSLLLDVVGVGEDICFISVNFKG